MKSQLLIKISAIAVLLGSNFAFEMSPAQASGERAREPEGKQYVGALVRSEQAFFLENSKFTTSLQELGNRSMIKSSSYSYSIKSLNKNLVQINAVPKIAGLRSFTGFAFVKQSSPTEATTLGGVCQSKQPNSKTPPKLSIVKNNVQCPTGYTNLSK